MTDSIIEDSYLRWTNSMIILQKISQLWCSFNAFIMTQSASGEKYWHVFAVLYKSPFAQTMTNDHGRVRARPPSFSSSVSLWIPAGAIIENFCDVNLLSDWWEILSLSVCLYPLTLGLQSSSDLYACILVQDAGTVVTIRAFLNADSTQYKRNCFRSKLTMVQTVHLCFLWPTDISRRLRRRRHSDSSCTLISWMQTSAYAANSIFPQFQEFFSIIWYYENWNLN